MNKKRVFAGLMAAAMLTGSLTGCGSKAQSSAADGGEGKVINIYSWNDEFRTRVEAVYPAVKETSKDGTITYLDDGCEIQGSSTPTRRVCISRSWTRPC